MRMIPVYSRHNNELPYENPFEIDVEAVFVNGTDRIHTGLCIEMSDDITLEIRSLHESVFILGWTRTHEGELIVAVHSGMQGEIEFKMSVAIVGRDVCPVRFVEADKGAIVRGNNG